MKKKKKDNIFDQDVKSNNVGGNDQNDAISINCGMMKVKT